MRKILPIIFFFLFLLNPSSAFATPNSEMTFGGASSNLPGKEFDEYFKAAFPVMKQIHGDPFSSFTFTVEGRPDVAEHGGGWYPIEKKVVLDEAPMRSYQDFLKRGSPQAGINSVEQGITHELSHAMYTYGNMVVTFPYAWINEGWAKTTELLTWLKVKGEPVRPGMYLAQYLDKDTVAGTSGLGRYKQSRNHGLIYDELTINSFNLLYGCSDSNLNPDFQIRLDQKIYDDYITKGKPLFMNKIIPEEDYKSLIKTLCAGRKIDGQDAYDWYFSQPATFTRGLTGFHLGVYPHWWAYTTAEGVDVFTFNRTQNTQDQDKTEKGISAQVSVEVFDVDGNSVFSKETQTDQSGNSVLNFGRDFLKDGAYYAIAKADYQGKKYQSKIFFMNIRDRDGTAEEQTKAQNPKEVIGVLVDKNLTPLGSKYTEVLKPLGGAVITENSNGVFTAKVASAETKEISFDFLGQNFTFTKPPFRRLVVVKLPDDLIKKAQQQPEFKLFVDNGFSKPTVSGNLRGGLPPIAGQSARQSLNLQKLALAFLAAVTVMGAGLAVYFFFIRKRKNPVEEIKENLTEKR